MIANLNPNAVAFSPTQKSFGDCSKSFLKPLEPAPPLGIENENPYLSTRWSDPCGGSHDSSPTSTQREQPTVCKYFLMGECKLVNCKFLHSLDAEAAICRYWARGHCMRGDQCRFMHEETTVVSESTSMSSSPPETFNMETAFPPFQSGDAPNSLGTFCDTPVDSGVYVPSLPSVGKDGVFVHSSITGNKTGLSPRMSLPLLPDTSTPTSLDRAKTVPDIPSILDARDLSPERKPLTPPDEMPLTPVGGPPVEPVGRISSELNALLDSPSIRSLSAANRSFLTISTKATVNHRSQDNSPSRPAADEIRSFSFPTTFGSIDSDNFSFMASGDEKSQQNSPSRASGGYLDLASRMKLRDLQSRLFPHVTADVVETSFKSFGCQFDTTEKFLCAEYGSIPEHLKSSAEPPPAKPEPIPHPSINYAKNKPAPKLEKWVATGPEVGRVYQKKRKDAIEHAEQRNKMFQRATQAFLQGDGKSAKAFSDKGRFHQEQMERNHTSAKTAIFRDRNKSFEKPAITVTKPLTAVKVVISSHKQERFTIDIHGLHRSEAIELLQRKLIELSSFPRAEYLDVLYGTGHHAEKRESTLEATILNFLDDQKMKYRKLSAGGRGGAVRVTL